MHKILSTIKRNKIDKKYIWSGKNRLSSYNRDLTKDSYYTGKLYGLPITESAQFKYAQSIVRQWDDHADNGSRILDTWSLLQEYYNKSDPNEILDAYRGLHFNEKNYRAFVRLLNNIYSRKSLITAKPQSWSRYLSDAFDYACRYGVYKEDAISRKNAAGIVLKGLFKYKEILDISYDSDEIISPPGTLGVDIYCAWCRVNNIFYYYLNKYHLNHYYTGIIKLDDLIRGYNYGNMYKFTDAQYKIKTLKEFVRIVNQN